MRDPRWVEVSTKSVGPLNLDPVSTEEQHVVSPPETNALRLNGSQPRTQRTAVDHQKIDHQPIDPFGSVAVSERLRVAEAELENEAGPTLTLVIPMFCEELRIERSLELLAGAGLDGVRLLLVDDGSLDSTVAVARASIARLDLPDASVLALPANVGKGGAVRAGVLAATTPFVGFVDADLSLDPHVIHQALVRLQTTRGDVVIGERIVDALFQPRLRRLASLSFRRLTRALAPTGVRDPQCALKLFRSDLAHSLFEPLLTNGFSFDVEILLRARQRGAAIDEMAIRWTHQPGSKVSPVADSLRMMAEVRRIRREVGPAASIAG